MSTNQTIATTEPTLQGRVLTEAETEAASKRTEAEAEARIRAERKAMWADYASLPEDAPKSQRIALLTEAVANGRGSITAGDDVARYMRRLDDATDAWQHTARVAAAMSRLGESVPAICRALGVTEKTKASETNGKRVTRMVRGWRVAVAAGDASKTGDALRPYVVFANVATEEQTVAAEAAAKSGKGIRAILSEVAADKAITAKATGTPRPGAGAPTEDATEDAAEVVAAGDVTADYLAGLTESNLVALVNRVTREARTRKYADPEHAAALATMLRTAADRISPEVTA